jgi:hypothetical protein
LVNWKRLETPPSDAVGFDHGPLIGCHPPKE